MWIVGNVEEPEEEEETSEYHTRGRRHRPHWGADPSSGHLKTVTKKKKALAAHGADPRTGQAKNEVMKFV